MKQHVIIEPLEDNINLEDMKEIENSLKGRYYEEYYIDNKDHFIKSFEIDLDKSRFLMTELYIINKI
jgi:hypothetical protein